MYDRLVDPRILEYAKKARKFYCGKFGGEAWKQDDINERLYREAKPGKVVVRLKNGDPFVFGRGGEELLYLLERGIEVEVVPGLSSALALPGLMKIPLTRRDLSSSITILSGQGAGGKKPRWSGLGDTVVVLMPIKNLHRITRKLIARGKNKNTPCALISRGTMAGERMFVSTLENIAKAVGHLNLKPPSVLVVGEVVGTLFDFKGRQVAAFRPTEEVKRTEQLIRDAGGIPNVYGICDIEPVSGPLKWAAEQKWDALVFMSASGVRSVSQFLNLKKYVTIAVGERTKQELERVGCKKVLVPKVQNLKGVEDFLKRSKWRVLAFRSSQAKDKLSGAINIPAYRLRFNKLDRIIRDYIKTKNDFTILTSAGLLKHLLKEANKIRLKHELVQKMNRTFVISLGEGITEYALGNGIQVNHELERPTLDSLFRGRD